MKRIFFAVAACLALSSCLEMSQSSDSNSSVPGCDSQGQSGQSNPHCTVAQVSIIASNVFARSLVVDSHGNLFYVALYVTADGVQESGSTIHKLAADGTDTVFASGTCSFLLAIDESDNIYSAPWVGSGYNDPGCIGGALYKISPTGVISTVGTIDSEPTGLAVDQNGNIFFTAEPANLPENVIKEMTPSGVVSVFAGSGMAGNANGNGTAASFNDPQGLAIDSSGNIYVVDDGNSIIRKITPTGDVTTFAGSGTNGSQDGSATTASFIFRGPGEQPNGIGISKSNVLYVGEEYHNGFLRAVAPDGSVTTYCGNGADIAVDGSCGFSGFYQSGSIAVGPDGSVYVVGPVINMATLGIIKISE